MTLEKLKELINAGYRPPLTEREAAEAVYALLGFFETLLEIEKDNIKKMTEGPALHHYLTTKDLEKITTLKVRFWECRRISGDGPPYISISKRAVRYKWGDVLEWLEKRKINNTAQMPQST